LNSDRPLPPTYFLIALLAMAALHWLYVPLPALWIISWPWNLLGVLPLAGGAWITLWADRLFKQLGTTVKPGERASRLVTEGPYRISRHPMYVGMTAILAGVAVLLATAAPWLAVAFFAAVMAAKFIPAEERAMEAAFGDAYLQYKRRVRPWL
jgi:protein-S-isoprenylcysteine O-methyltransferase Ste14